MSIIGYPVRNPSGDKTGGLSHAPLKKGGGVLMESYITIDTLLQIGVFMCAYTTLLLVLFDHFDKKK